MIPSPHNVPDSVNDVIGQSVGGLTRIPGANLDQIWACSLDVLDSVLIARAAIACRIEANADSLLGVFLDTATEQRYRMRKRTPRLFRWNLWRLHR